MCADLTKLWTEAKYTMESVHRNWHTTQNVCKDHRPHDDRGLIFKNTI